MTDDTVTPVDIDDLDAFEADFYQTAKAEPEKEEAPEEEVDETESDQLAPEADESDDDEDESEDESEDEEDEEPEEDPKPKKNRKSAKERIEELVAKNREQERREAELLRRLEQLEARNKEVKEPEEKTPTLREALPSDAPSPDAEGEDGKPLYPLGEFDPAFIRDLTRYTIETERKAADERAAKEREEQELEAARTEIQNNWVARVEEVEKELPDLREKIGTLSRAFEGLDEGYGDYLASTIMSSEFGPQIMYHLSQNIGEAQKIVASGPAAATLAIGRLEARFVKTEEKEEPKRNKRMSDAPEPPANRSRGAHGKFAPAPDTDDLEAFEREYFK